MTDKKAGQDGFVGKIAVVTGGTQGLGAPIAAPLARRGLVGLVLCGRNAEKGMARAAAIETDTGCRTVFVAADLQDVAACRTVIATADRLFGHLNVLANAAGMTDRGSILDTSEALFDAIFVTNVRAPFFLMQEAIALMRRDDVECAIVNIGSMSSLAGQSFITAWCASKGALATLTRNVAFSSCATGSG